MYVLNSYNWDHSYLRSKRANACITQGSSEKINNILYFVTIVDDEEHTLFQKSFEDIDLALKHINNACHGWELIETTPNCRNCKCPTKKAESGCKGCSN
ncbi:MAG: hypothetical protein ACOCUH_01115 [Bacteriovoracia bacterium]